MMVVSDTSPLNYLILIQVIDVLPVVFDRVTVPPAVIDELRHPNSPAVVQAWAAATPAWLDIQAPGQIDPALKLGAGEMEAIALAVQLSADQFLVDDRQARTAAAARGLAVLGTLGVLLAASARGLLNFHQAVTRLQQTTFHATPAVWQQVLASAGPTP